MTRRTYDTWQRKSILSVMVSRADAYLTVDEVLSLLKEQDIQVGRTTVYRTLERLVDEGRMLKVADVRGGAAQYRSAAPEFDATQGQLRCERCGRVLTLSCSMLESFAGHILDEHGFEVDRSKTVLYGICGACAAAACGVPEDATPSASARAAAHHRCLGQCVGHDLSEESCRA
ncbi:transcriptional repressor [Collinsella sp. AGMB00827]|uniref:Transcriptional repressor n=1 Tax=Collinsella ureilytica TaxID=2869515 RepID=A0ABS7MLQ3_9ACTN|nr:transcriptional repressor [Collinsella urealyticum]MBY4798297.1 transcriptional repressor [Collinsella urealyticum]